jgi:hypothetical protein
MVEPDLRPPTVCSAWSRRSRSRSVPAASPAIAGSIVSPRRAPSCRDRELVPTRRREVAVRPGPSSQPQLADFARRSRARGRPRGGVMTAGSGPQLTFGRRRASTRAASSCEAVSRSAKGRQVTPSRASAATRGYGACAHAVRLGRRPRGGACIGFLVSGVMRAFGPCGPQAAKKGP